MCGIVGVISWSETHRVTRADLKRMTDAIAHRGPDGEGFYFNIDPDDRSQTISPENPQVAFGFRRLAVLDPDPRSMQPFLSTDGRYVMVFNGEIYNFRELREELTKLDPSYVWRTQGDTEVLIQSYARWGEDCLHKLNGMFAIAIWDHEKKSLFLARDRMGQKPLWHDSFPDGVVSFGSETSAHRGLMAALDYFTVNFLRYGYCLQSHPIGGQLNPCHALIYRRHSDGYDLSCYQYDLSRAEPKESARDSLSAKVSSQEIRSKIHKSVERQLVSDVPLGVFLSGGVDSSIVALCARKHGPVKTFSIAFDDPRYDESPHAREVAKHLGTDHHEFRVTPNVIEDLPKLARVFGEPFADSSMIPTHYLCRETKKHVTVALSGDGGDELFGGYDRYTALALGKHIPRLLGRPLRSLACRLSQGNPKSRLTRAARFAAMLGLDADERYETLVRVFNDALIIELLIPGPRPGVPSAWEAIQGMVYAEPTGDGEASLPRLEISHRMWYRRQHSGETNVVRAALAVDRVTYLPNDLLTKVDRCSMLHSLEVRSPFMDHELVELAAQLTEDQLLKGGKKRMLREAFASELPASVFKRPKMGFAVPIGEWFRGPLRAFLRDHLFAADSFAKAHFKMPVVERLVAEHETEKRDHSQRLYALLMLEMWWKYCVGTEQVLVSADHAKDDSSPLAGEAGRGV